jgi:hypothetical protein
MQFSTTICFIRALSSVESFIEGNKDVSEYFDGKDCDLTLFPASQKTRANRLLIRAHNAGIHR